MVTSMFEQGRLSSNSLKFENSEIKLIKGNELHQTCYMYLEQILM